MGKISDALQKVMQERECQTRQVAYKVTVQTKQKKDPFPVFDKEDKQRKIMPEPQSLRRTAPISRLNLEDRLRQKERVHVVKAANDSGIDPRVVAYYDYNSPVAEQYRTLRTNVKSYLRKTIASNKLKRTRQLAGPRIVTITSSIQGEGKTVTAVNLAVCLAHDFESRVLLIDCDLRRGSVDRMLNVPHAPGLLEMFEDKIQWPDAFHQTKINNLFVIPTGDISKKPAEMLGSRKMRMIIERLRAERFTYIILDTPPLLPFTDAGVLGAQTDGVIMVVQSRRTQQHTVRKANECLRQAQAQVLGFVLTHSDRGGSDFYGNYYYYQYNQRKELTKSSQRKQVSTVR